MTKPDYTGLLLVIDRSGSMQSIRDDMVGGLNELLRAQAAEPGEMTVDVVIFDNRYETTHTMASPSDVEIRLEPRGMTALHDALGRAVTEYGAKLASMDESDRPSTVIVAVATDGLENASTEWTPEAVRALIEQQQTHYDWDFVFLGANQDAITTAGHLGIRRDSAIDFDADADGVQAVSYSLSAYISERKTSRSAAFTDESRRRSKKDPESGR